MERRAETEDERRRPELEKAREFPPIAKGFKESPGGPNAQPKASQRQPNVSPFAPQNGASPVGEETGDGDGRDFQRPPVEEISCRIKRREERDAEPAIGHGVQY